jgi:dimethylhistidine N-methyltransferase
MPTSYTLLRTEDLDGQAHQRESFALDVLMGLSSSPKHLPSKYFYDEVGSSLFNRITRLPEYYLTACEQEILSARGGDLAALLSGEPLNLVELGPGEGRKTETLVQALLAHGVDFRYLPIDISRSALESLAASLGRQFPDLTIEGLVADYFTGLRWLSRQQIRNRTCVLLLGSNIGNFSRAEARTFLRSLWNSLHDGDLVLIGFDLKKDIDVMLEAYNDSQGVTRDFNLNLLHRINRELLGDFAVDRFRFFSTYDVFSGSINSYLVSLEEQSVFVGAIGQRFHFRPWEPIRTEYSYKYLESDIESLAAETGFRVEMQLYDARRFFADSLWRVVKEARS